MTRWRRNQIGVALGVMSATVGCNGVDPVGVVVEACALTREGVGTQSLLQPGTLEGDDFTPLADGDPLVIIDAPQGGTWAMPAARFTGVSREGTLSAAVSLDGDEVVGALLEARVRLEEAPEGALQVDYIPIQIGGEAAGISADELSGMAALLRVELVDGCERRVESEVAVTLRYGAGGN